MDDSIAPQEGLPPPVRETRQGILTAVEQDDYEALRPWLDPEVFLSDYGFGIEEEPDPIARWEERGGEPLETMRALLRMEYQRRETNEGRLFEWPTYGPDTEGIRDVTPADRELFLTVMAPEEFEELFLPELGYVGPRLGILRDGTWWFFILDGEA